MKYGYLQHYGYVANDVMKNALLKFQNMTGIPLTGNHKRTEYVREMTHTQYKPCFQEKVIEDLLLILAFVL